MKDSKLWSQAESYRFSQAATSLLFFTTSAYVAAKILLSKEWLFERKSWTEIGFIIDADYKFYYLIYASRFFSDLVSLFFEDRKKVRKELIPSLFNHPKIFIPHISSRVHYRMPSLLPLFIIG